MQVLVKICSKFSHVTETSPNFEELLLSFTSYKLFKLKASPLMSENTTLCFQLYMFSVKTSIKIGFSFFFLRTAETAYVRQLNYICFALHFSFLRKNDPPIFSKSNNLQVRKLTVSTMTKL